MIKNKLISNYERLATELHSAAQKIKDMRNNLNYTDLYKHDFNEKQSQKFNEIQDQLKSEAQKLVQEARDQHLAQINKPKTPEFHMQLNNALMMIQQLGNKITHEEANKIMTQFEGHVDEQKMISRLFPQDTGFIVSVPEDLKLNAYKALEEAIHKTYVQNVHDHIGYSDNAASMLTMSFVLDRHSANID